MNNIKNFGSFVNKFDNFNKLNESDKDRDIFSHRLVLSEPDEEISEPDEYISDDGWNGDTLEEIGLIEWVDRVQNISYELKNGRRGSYAIDGDTGEDLKNELLKLRDELSNVIDNM